MADNKRGKRTKPSVKEAAVRHTTPPAASAIRPQKRIMAGVCAALVLVCIAIYAQTLSHDFVNYDDNLYVTETPQVQAGLSWANVAWAFTTNRAVHMHPLTWMSHMLDCDLYGLRPWGHHLTSVIIHTIGSVLLFLVFARITRRLWPSAIVAALFAVHPLHVESVAWVADRKDLLSMLFWTGSLGAYAWYRERSGPVRYLAMTFLFLLGLMSKTTVATLPFVLLLLDYWPLGQMNITAPFRVMARKAVRLAVEKTPLFLMAALFCASTLVMQVRGNTTMSFGQKVSIAARCANAVVVYVLYLVKTVWPSDLAVFYPHPIARPVWQVAGAALTLAAITLFCLNQARRRPYLVVGWFWYLGTLVPVIELVQFATFSHADRYTYIPLIGIFIMGAWGAADLAAAWNVPKRAVAAASGAALVALAVRAGVQASYWRDDETLFRHAIAVGQESDIAFSNLGKDTAERGRYDEAAAYLAKALVMDPGNVVTLNNLGMLAKNQGRNDEAMAYLKKAVDLKPDYVKALSNLGVLAMNQGQNDEAETCLKRVLDLNPDHVDTLCNLGKLVMDLGRLEDARAYLKRAFDLDPKSLSAQVNLGACLLLQGQYEEGQLHLRKALEIDPQCIPAMNNLAFALSKLGRQEEANGYIKKAEELEQARAVKKE